ncbi:glycosyltransferase [Caldivirga maquilingensis]|uniref:Glycosyl transferase family 1 domain-containing protein n=1 Tax=Caldivirga maquilingensis (strain ATCC 700844 / DSM 13496 / JCM 10307 / IC-167) TaxID=397948 RepID=A8M958_CALMQ|nr:glycosyltransferase [Caldivirga maquilingensis]ABW02277.1 hypothetical protein Cmaq_1452 [Caldivirga maquilingensis IC-167]
MVIDEYLSKRELYTLISQHDLYIHGSLSDGFGLPVIESMAVGVPPVVLDAPPWNEVVNDSVGFLVKVGRENIIMRKPYKFKIRIFREDNALDTLEYALNEVMNNRMGWFTKVRKYIRQRYDAHSLYKEFAKLLE